MPRKKEKPISDENARMLRKIADLLDAHAKGQNLSPVQARAASHVMRRILEAPQGISRYSKAQHLEQAIALACRYRRVLAAGKRHGRAPHRTNKAQKTSADAYNT